MKKVAIILMTLILVSALACPVFAAGEDFVPSITYKEEPEVEQIVGENKEPVKNDKGEVAIGQITGSGAADIKKEDTFLFGSDIVVTPISKVDKSEVIPEAAQETLKQVYEDLDKGTTKLPYEKVADYDGENMVIRELFDISCLDVTKIDGKTITEVIEPEGVSVTLTFNLGVDAKAKVIVMTYKNNEWNPIASVKNNGDGTVTCVFEHFCPVAISVEQVGEEVDTPSKTGDNAELGLWMTVMAVSAVALVALFTFGRRKEAK